MCPALSNGMWIDTTCAPFGQGGLERQCAFYTIFSFTCWLMGASESSWKPQRWQNVSQVSSE
jgi:hypothetical protein